MCSLSTTQMALAFHPDSKVKTQEAYNCVANFLDSLEEQEIKEKILSESKNAKQMSIFLGGPIVHTETLVSSKK